MALSNGLPIGPLSPRRRRPGGAGRTPTTFHQGPAVGRRGDRHLRRRPDLGRLMARSERPGAKAVLDQALSFERLVKDTPPSRGSPRRVSLCQLTTHGSVRELRCVYVNVVVPRVLADHLDDLITDGDTSSRSRQVGKGGDRGTAGDTGRGMQVDGGDGSNARRDQAQAELVSSRVELEDRCPMPVGVARGVDPRRPTEIRAQTVPWRRWRPIRTWDAIGGRRFRFRDSGCRAGCRCRRRCQRLARAAGL